MLKGISQSVYPGSLAPLRVVSNTNEKYCITDTNIFLQKALPIPIAILLLKSIANTNKSIVIHIAILLSHIHNIISM